MEQEKPLGAIHNGRVHLDRLVNHYHFTCEAGSLEGCKEYADLVRCFETLAEYVERDQ